MSNKTISSKVKGYERSNYRDHGPDFLDGEDMEDPSTKLYGLQNQVPRLPVPDLNETFELFLNSVKPHVTQDEFKETMRKVYDFKNNGLAEKCQDRLLALKEERKNSSWFNALWNEYAYLGYRGSVVWNVTYFLQFKDELPKIMKSPCRRAARIAYHSLEFKEWLTNGTLTPDMSGRTKVPMSNSQYKYMYNTVHMPGKKVDFVRTYAPDVYNHIVVARKNRFYVFDTIDSSKNKLSIDQLHAQLERIKMIADRQGTDNYPVGVLTAVDRDDWYKNRTLLVSGLTPEQCNQNKEALELIESASLMICLDDTSPTTRAEVGHALLHSDGRNRYWDKSLQFIIFENGKAGFAGEHAMMDGTTTCRMVNHVLDRMFHQDDESLAVGQTPFPLAQVSEMLPEPMQINIALDKACREAVLNAGRVFDEEMATKDLNVLMFHGYGKNQLKKFKVSPDAYAQLVIQYAYYRTFGQIRGTYESTQTRTYLHGRTEVTRSVTNESKEFCEAMMQSNLSKKELHKLLVNATVAHSSYIGKAAKGKGCDRHLLGLKMMMKENESAELFSDVGFIRSGTWAISTSGLVGEFMEGWGFGEVVPHGIGVGYTVQNDRIRYTITSRHGWSDRMKANLETALIEMRDLCLYAATLPTSKL